MESLTIKDVLELLKGKGTEVGDEAADAAKDKFGGLTFADPESLLREGETRIREGALKEIKGDRTKFKKRAEAAEERAKELKDALESGESVVVKERDRYKAENESLRPVIEKYQSEKKKMWDEHKEKIPDKLKGYYVFPEEGKELSDEQILANVAKFEEHRAIGALEVEVEKPEGEKTPEGFRKPAGGRGKKTGKPDLSEMKPGEKMLEGYKSVDRRKGDEGETEE